MALNQPVDPAAEVHAAVVSLTDGQRELARLVGQLLADEWYRKASAAQRREKPDTAGKETATLD
jgi:hypothetical protein